MEHGIRNFQLSKDGKIDSHTDVTRENTLPDVETTTKAKGVNRATSEAKPHLIYPGYTGPLTKTQERHMKAKQNIE